ncbi:MAG TPA: WG repeat-containing protein [Sediminibacterium sp.]|nr:WG repeat-containing protein [Sediminibacterium sp.]
MNVAIKIGLFGLLMVACISCKERAANNPAQREQELKHAYEAKRLLLQERYRFRMLYEFSEGLACFETDSSVGAVDSSGKYILEFKHATALSPFSHGLAVLTHKHPEERRSFVNRQGQVVFNAWENGLVYIDPFDEYGYSFVTDQQGNRGLLDTTFRLVFPLKYENIMPLAAHRFLVTKDFKSGIADRNGNFLVPARFDQIDAFTPDQKMFAQINEQWGIYDSTGKLLHAYDCDGLLYTGGLILLNRWNKTGGGVMALADTAGNIVVPYGRYDDCSSSHEGLAMVYNRQDPVSSAIRNNPLLFGYVDLNGKERIPLQYEDAYSFQDGLAKVKKNGKWGYIDTSGKTVIDLVYDKAGLFYNGFATVERNGKAAVIDQKGTVLIQY